MAYAVPSTSASSRTSPPVVDLLAGHRHPADADGLYAHVAQRVPTRTFADTAEKVFETGPKLELELDRSANKMNKSFVC